MYNIAKMFLTENHATYMSDLYNMKVLYHLVRL